MFMSSSVSCCQVGRGDSDDASEPDPEWGGGTVGHGPHSLLGHVQPLQRTDRHGGLVNRLLRLQLNDKEDGLYIWFCEVSFK